MFTVCPKKSVQQVFLLTKLIPFTIVQNISASDSLRTTGVKNLDNVFFVEVVWLAIHITLTKIQIVDAGDSILLGMVDKFYNKAGYTKPLNLGLSKFLWHMFMNGSMATVCNRDPTKKEARAALGTQRIVKGHGLCDVYTKSNKAIASGSPDLWSFFW